LPNGKEDTTELKEQAVKPVKDGKGVGAVAKEMRLLSLLEDERSWRFAIYAPFRNESWASCPSRSLLRSLPGEFGMSFCVNRLSPMRAKLRLLYPGAASTTIELDVTEAAQVVSNQFFSLGRECSRAAEAEQPLQKGIEPSGTVD
jgi:hypothetical protein